MQRESTKVMSKRPDEAERAVLLSRRGKKIGRPQTRFEALETVPTRCPIAVHQYLKGLAGAQRLTMTTMFEDMMRRFLTDKPWEHGLLWRKPKVATSSVHGTEAATQWVQANVQLPAELIERVAQVAATNGVSKASLVYTAMFWWVQYIYPPGRPSQQ